ncbi:ABC transporter substrate-binding protein [Actinokineospora fastidiosa]|uniref:Amino acid ABC transporter substrate-binding protein n=1 Tax=Actinokineospora fastidiosa TaxID=1816 RepID=A0A918GMQ6_9PSEU|nr:ABC transporter substrate-binding protein [Actinokineospora fastidiosa]GGS47568.1 amino acid ABC transporter substrate-binding protein [Actinokineospora fastidiosa]
MRMTALLGALVLTACAPVAEQPTPTGPSCVKATLPTLTPGTFTFATDEPVYQPWYQDNDPSNGRGFESAVAYAVAEYLGYDRGDVVWTRVPFNAAIQPGRKTFDANLTEFSITEERRQAVDFSAPYYDVAQAVITLSSSPAAEVTTLEGLRAVKLGAQVGTTSYAAAAALGAEQDVAVYNTNDDAKAALTSGQIDALVLDLPTAFYMTSAELTDGKIVGQLPRGNGKPEQFGIVLDKGSPLTQCVSSAVEALRANGILARLEQEWLASSTTAPELR